MRISDWSSDVCSSDLEVDEQTFFYSKETGGTLVSSALEKMLSIVAARYRPEDWNIYVAQASDGDNMSIDNPKSAKLMRNGILPISQYVAYLEVGRDGDPLILGSVPRQSDLWRPYEDIATAEAARSEDSAGGKDDV